MLRIRDYHMHRRNASDILANGYAGPDDLLWTGRPLDRDNWAHAYVSRSWSSVHASAKAFCYKTSSSDRGRRMALNTYAFGLEVVGNFDSEDPATSRSMNTALSAAAIMADLWSIDLDSVLLFHRWVANKSCPGDRVSLSWIRQEVAARMETAPAPANSVAVVAPDGSPVDCRAYLGDDARTWGQLGPVLKAAGVRFNWTADPKTIRILEGSL
jgi:hypothetical protein